MNVNVDLFDVNVAKCVNMTIIVFDVRFAIIQKQIKKLSQCF